MPGPHRAWPYRLPSAARSQPDAQLPHVDELQAAHDDYVKQLDAARGRAHAWSVDDEAVSPTLELPKLARVLSSLSAVALHARTVVRHGCDANCGQPDGR